MMQEVETEAGAREVEGRLSYECDTYDRQKIASVARVCSLGYELCFLA